MAEVDFRRVLILSRKAWLKGWYLAMLPTFQQCKTHHQEAYPLKANYVNQKSTMNEIMKMYFLFEHGDFPAGRVSFRAVYIDFDIKCHCYCFYWEGLSVLFSIPSPPMSIPWLCHDHGDLNTSGEKKKTSFVFSSVCSQINSNQLLLTKQMAQQTRFLYVPDKYIDHSWSEFSRRVGEIFRPPQIVRSRMFDAL